MIEQFHFLRPYWLITLIVLPFLLWQRRGDSMSHSNWSQVVDAHLFAALKVSADSVSSRWPIKPMLALAVLAMAFALAGPTWSKTEQPVFGSDNARVFVLDLSHSMDATDVTPSRLVRAKLKLLDMLNASTEGQVALVTFAATPFVVSPLTSDAQTVVSLVSAVDTNIVPVQGSQADLALKKAADLLTQAQVNQGEIILITDEVNDAANKEAEQLAAKGVRLHVLAVGTAAGAPVPLPGGSFLKDDNGAIVMPKLNEASLRTLASLGGGLYQTASADDSDVKLILSAASTPSVDRHKQNENSAATERWQDQGFWLAIIALPLMLMFFRRGVLVVLLAISFSGHSAPTWAVEWSDAWQRKDQQAADMLKRGDAAQAAQTFTGAEWKGMAYYKAGDYENAYRHFTQANTVDAQYNAANALAKMGRLEEAVRKYDEVLKSDADHADAKFNRELIDKFLKQRANENEKDKSASAQNDASSKDQSGQEKPDKGNQGNSTEQKQGNNKNENDAAQQSQPGSPREQKQGAQAENKPGGDKKENPARAAQADKQNGDDKNATEENRLEQQTPADKEQAQAVQQWLRRIPDDPGGLLREKYRRQMQKEQQALDQEKKW